MKFFIQVIFLALVSCSPQPVRNPATSQKNTLLCSAPESFVCKETGQTKNSVLGKYVKDIKSLALAAAAESVGITQGDLKIEDFRNLKKMHPESVRKKRRLAFVKYFETLDSLLLQDYRARFPDKGAHPLESFHLVDIKNLLKLAITNKVEDRQKRALLFSVIQSVELASIYDILNRFHQQLDDELLGNYYDSCGFDGLDDNAFAYKTKKGGKPLIVICAGAIAASYLNQDETTGNRTPIFPKLLVTMAHEISHHFDGNHPEFRPVYRQLAQCLSQTSDLDLMPEPEKKGASPSDILQDHLGEITADFWGAQVLAEYFRSQKIDDLRKKTSLLNSNYEDLCHTPDDGIHPSGKWRMEFSLHSTDLGEALGCNKQTTCNLDGLK